MENENKMAPIDFHKAFKATTVKPVLVATSIKQATCIKQAGIQFSKQADTLKCTCIKQAPVLSKRILIILKQVGPYFIFFSASFL